MKRFLLFIFIFGLPHLTFALTPPHPPERLKEESELIVKGKVIGPVKCVGLVEKNACASNYEYETPFLVKKILKGKLDSRQILLHFIDHDYGKSTCVGDQGASVHEGDEGLFYLSKRNGRWIPVHWSGVKLTRHGSTPWPPCP